MPQVPGPLGESQVSTIPTTVPALARTFLTTSELAALVRRAPKTVRSWRSQGVGPAYVKLGREVVYAPAAVEDWLARHTITTEGTAA